MTDNDSLTAVLRVLNPKPLMKKLSPDIAGRLILHLLQNWQLFNDQYEWIESLVEIAPKAGDLASQLFDILSESFTKDTRLRESWTKYKERVMSIR